jgi:hypothetical protein
MRVASCSLCFPLVIAAACGSNGSSSTKPEAAPTDAASDPATAPPDGAGPDRASDPVATPDQDVAPDANAPAEVLTIGETAADLARADAIRDLPRPDTPAPGEAGGGEVAAPTDLASSPDAVTKPEATTPADATPDGRPGDGAAAEVVAAEVPPAVEAAPPEAGADTTPSAGRTLGGCPILPANHIFNTPIDNLPVHPNSAAFMGTIGNRNLHLDLGTQTDMSADDYYGIPWNTFPGASAPWVAVSYSSTDPDMGSAYLDETDCVDQSSGAAHTVVSPCLASKAPAPWLPIPAKPLVEGGIVTDPSQPYGDHHLLIIDTDVCRLWELYHCYPNTSGGWDIFGSATWDLNSNALRPKDWTSADAAGFPILPLLLLAREASQGEIKHALRFTISSSSIRREYVWPARHLTTNGTTSSSLPPMGQLFRIKASYQIPSSYGTQSKAILQALKTYGMYVADGGTNLYIQGEPSADWQDGTFSQVQSVGSSVFEAVDLSPIMGRAGFDPDSAAVPPP